MQGIVTTPNLRYLFYSKPLANIGGVHIGEIVIFPTFYETIV